MKGTSRRRRPIYVESRINAPIERVWEATQEPEDHQRWDGRFGKISYFQRADGEPQRFTVDRDAIYLDIA